MFVACLLAAAMRSFQLLFLLLFLLRAFYSLLIHSQVQITDSYVEKINEFVSQVSKGETSLSTILLCFLQKITIKFNVKLHCFYRNRKIFIRPTNFNYILK